MRLHFSSPYMGNHESDEQIIARKQREREVTAAWKQFRSGSPRSVRRALAALPAANPSPKAIIVTRNRHVDRTQTDWKAWGTPGRRP